MSLGDVGSRLRDARIAVGITQKELAARMGSARSVVCRAEAGQTFPTVDFVERYANALGTRIELSFGPRQAVGAKEMYWRARQGFRGIIHRHGRFFPPDADAILRTRRDDDPAELYLEMLRRASSATERDWRWRDLGDPECVHAPTAIAAMYWEIIDWVSVRRRVEPWLRRLDAKIRKQAWAIVTRPAPIPLQVTSGEWVSKGAADAWAEGVKALGAKTPRGARGGAR